MTAELPTAAGGAESVAPAAANAGHYGQSHASDGKLKLPSGRSASCSATSAPARSTPSAKPLPAITRSRPTRLHIYGVLSLVFWSMMLVVTLKYVMIIMRADNKGEGGSLALLALISRSTARSAGRWPIILLGVFATALFYGDSMITPAISVLSAVEGLTCVEARFAPYIVPIAVGILIGLFMIQSRGTAKVGALFGPIMLVYFVTLAALGIMHIADNPWIIAETLNPVNALRFFYVDGFTAFLALGSVVLAVTGR